MVWTQGIAAQPRPHLIAMCAIYIKNTFINGFEDEDFRVPKGHHSYPPSPRDQRASVCQQTFLEELEKSLSRHTQDGNPVEADEAKSLCNDVATSNERASSMKKGRRRVNRPCKEKRHHYIKFVMRVCTQVEEDPVSFNISNTPLPPSLIANPKKYVFFSSTHSLVSAATVGR